MREPASARMRTPVYFTRSEAGRFVQWASEWVSQAGRFEQRDCGPLFARYSPLRVSFFRSPVALNGAAAVLASLRSLAHPPHL